ncbi:hypothetical protein IV59_GL001779 [Paucilactobacillus hokkaidonensis]|nr:hypothetical protein IV59_GL001779 [Paucilactobacillus hokkaidonensis]
MVNYQAKQWEWQGQKFEVQPGQFITSIESIKENAGKNISIQNVRSALKRFEKLNFLTNESTKTGRLITVANWGKYQSEETNPTKKATKTQQRPNKDLTPTKNIRTKEVKPLAGKADESKINYKEFINWFNEQTGKGFKDVESNRKLIRARLNEGFTKSELALVVKFKSQKWKDDVKMSDYLRLNTLFAPSHFNDYLNEAIAFNKKSSNKSQVDDSDTDIEEMERKRKEADAKIAEEKARERGLI